MILMRANPLLGPLEGVGLENLLSHINSRYINCNITIKCGTSSVFFIYSFAMKLLIPKFVTVSIAHFSDFYICALENLKNSPKLIILLLYCISLIYHLFLDFCF